MRRIKCRIIRMLMLVTLAGLFSVPAYAQEISEAAPDADTEVSGSVSGEVSNPSYVIRIPSAINFGTLKKPKTNSNAYKDISFDVTMISLSDLQPGQVVCVLARDAAWSTGGAHPDSPFSIKKGEHSLAYYVYAGSHSPDSGKNLYDSEKWYPNGLLYGSFGQGSEGKSIPGALRLNQKQLFDKELSAYEGAYNGTLKFYTAIVNASDY